MSQKIKINLVDLHDESTEQREYLTYASVLIIGNKISRALSMNHLGSSGVRIQISDSSMVFLDGEGDNKLEEFNRNNAMADLLAEITLVMDSVTGEGRNNEGYDDNDTMVYNIMCPYSPIRYPNLMQNIKDVNFKPTSMPLLTASHNFSILNVESFIDYDDAVESHGSESFPVNQEEADSIQLTILTHEDNIRECNKRKGFYEEQITDLREKVEGCNYNMVYCHESDIADCEERKSKYQLELDLFMTAKDNILKEILNHKSRIAELKERFSQIQPNARLESAEVDDSAEVDSSTEVGQVVVNVHPVDVHLRINTNSDNKLSKCGDEEKIASYKAFYDEFCEGVSADLSVGLNRSDFKTIEWANGLSSQFFNSYNDNLDEAMRGVPETVPVIQTNSCAGVLIAQIETKLNDLKRILIETEENLVAKALFTRNVIRAIQDILAVDIVNDVKLKFNYDGENYIVINFKELMTEYEGGNVRLGEPTVLLNLRVFNEDYHFNNDQVVDLKALIADPIDIGDNLQKQYAVCPHGRVSRKNEGSWENNLCLGEFNQAVDDTLKRGSYKETTYTIAEFIKSYNMEDGYGRAIAEFPTD